MNANDLSKILVPTTHEKYGSCLNVSEATYAALITLPIGSLFTTESILPLVKMFLHPEAKEANSDLMSSVMWRLVNIFKCCEVVDYVGRGRVYRVSADVSAAIASRKRANSFIRRTPDESSPAPRPHVVQQVATGETTKVVSLRDRFFKVREELNKLIKEVGDIERTLLG